MHSTKIYKYRNNNYLNPKYSVHLREFDTYNLSLYKVLSATRGEGGSKIAECPTESGDKTVCKYVEVWAHYKVRHCQGHHHQHLITSN